MNCPCHCLIFGHRRRSYRELPWRVADFGRLHRYERGGVVHGLARVRSFCQDDSHIFCTEEQLASEIEAFMRLFYGVYAAFGFTKIDIKLATRPEHRMGADALWDVSEKALADALTRRGPSLRGHPRRGRLLRAQARVPHRRRAQAQLAARHPPARLQPARGLRSQLHRAGRQGASPRHAPPRHPRLDRALPRHLHRAHRRRLPRLARARAGGGDHGEREAERLRRAGGARSSRARGCAPGPTSATTSSAPRSATLG
jgi:hypothetical protein